MINKRRRRSDQFNVEMVVDILEKQIFPKYGSKKRISHHFIHKKPQDKYFKVCLRITEYLKEYRGVYKNSIKQLIYDYLNSVYGYYNNFSREPYLTQISPSTSNQIRFEEFVHNYTREYEEEYWFIDDPNEEEIIDVPILQIDLPDIIELKGN